MRIAIIGAGISGLSTAHLLKDKGNDVTLYERDKEAGGLIRCKRVDGSLFHICGGHVFNSKRQDVLDWFWNHFNREEEFTKADRNSIVFMEDGKEIPYPIENHVYLFEDGKLKGFIADLLEIYASKGEQETTNFEDFLLHRFGNTLYEDYFQPYNEKVWRRDLKRVPISWLEGKLPMPTVEEMLWNNIRQVKEKQFVHSTFWYEKQNGSQHIVDKLSRGLDIHYNFYDKIVYKSGKWIVDGTECDKVVFCGNVKTLPPMIKGIDLKGYATAIEKLESHGTTSVFCEIDRNPYSWIYMPSRRHKSHRIICTGNFAESNNASGKMTATIEFTDEISKADILDNLTRIPLHPKYLAHHFNEYTYPIQDKDTREMIKSLKRDLSHNGFYMTGRFADWEYYNMDAAIGAAMDMIKDFSL